jgi:2-oxoglutarate dehydrogenase E1 component
MKATAPRTTWQICVPTTRPRSSTCCAARLIRKQRKPLIIMSPKSLLRHKEACSTLEDLANGEFQTRDRRNREARCQEGQARGPVPGQDLLRAARASSREQDHRHRAGPHRAALSLPDRGFAKAIEQFPNAKEIVWCQEEPRNQGAWYWLASRQHLVNSSAPERRCCW